MDVGDRVFKTYEGLVQYSEVSKIAFRNTYIVRGTVSSILDLPKLTMYLVDWDEYVQGIWNKAFTKDELELIEGGEINNR